MNAAEQYAHFKYVREGVFNAVASNHDPYAAVFSLFNTAEQIINQSLKVYRKVDTSQSITTSTSDLLYTLPGDMIGQMIVQSGVQLVYSDNTIETVEMISGDRARELFGDFTNPNGKNSGPRYWWINEFDPSQFYLAWPATQGGTLRITYVANPTHPFSSANSIYGGSASIHVDVTNGSKTVTMNGTPAKTLFALDTNDGPLFQIGLGSTATIPSKWYDVDTVTVVGGNITVVTLKENYLESTATSQAFVAAQQGDVARQLKSERDGFLPVWFALGTLMRTGDKAQQQDFMAQFNSRLLLAAPFNPHMRMRSGPIAGSRAAFARPRSG